MGGMSSHYPWWNAIRQAFRLVWRNRFGWMMTSITAAVAFFIILPLEIEVDYQQKRTRLEERELEELRSRVKRLQTIKTLVAERDPFTMERLARAEFRLVRTKP